MSARDEQYRWWLLDGNLELVSDGNLSADTLQAALVTLNRSIDRVGDRGLRRFDRPYSLIVYQGAAIVAWRPPTLGVC